MQKLLSLILLTILFSCSQNSDNKAIISKLESCMENKNYFELRKTYNTNKDKISEKNQLFFESYINNVFSNYKLSNENIEKIFNKYQNQINDTIKKNLLSIKMANHINLYEYESSVKAADLIINNYSNIIDSSNLKSYKNARNLFAPLSKVPVQKIKRSADCEIDLLKDKIGLYNIKVNFNTNKGDKEFDLIFDTGANLSVVSSAFVKEFGLRELSSGFKMGTFTGKELESKLAIADSLKIGNLCFYNVVFSVLDEKTLTIPQLDFKIKGIIGFPVISMMEEIRFSKNKIFIPKNPVKYNYNNMAIDGMNPVVSCKVDNKDCRFHFDTGAKSTDLYKQYFDENKTEIEKKYKEVDITFGGAGGAVTEKGYKIPKILLAVAGSEVQLDTILVHNKLLHGGEINIHGNLGRDFINQFDQMIMSYKYSSLLFKNE
jgi:predicted aspartyl protease